jgi:hypothetical protein
MKGTFYCNNLEAGKRRLQLRVETNKNERGKSLFVIHKKKEKSINSSRTPTKLEYGHSLYKGESQTINV